MKILFLEESNHLSYFEKPLTIGGWVIPKERIGEINDEIKEIKKRHGIKPLTEMKWTKIGKGKIEAYKEVVNYALNNEHMQLRVLVALLPNNLKLSYKQWYTRLHYSLIIKSPFTIKGVISDKKGRGNEKELDDTLQLSFSTPAKEYMESNQSQILQLSDIFLGAISSHKFSIESKYKLEIYNEISKKINLGNSTPLSSKQEKYNIFYWRSEE